MRSFQARDHRGNPARNGRHRHRAHGLRGRVGPGARSDRGDLSQRQTDGLCRPRGGRSSEPAGRPAVRASRRIVFRPDRHFDRRVRSAWAHRPGIVLLVSRNPRQALSWLRRLVPFVPTRIPAALPCWFLLGRFSTPRLENAIAQVLAQIAPDAFRARLTSIIDVDVTARLADVRVPVLYLRDPRSPGSSTGITGDFAVKA